MSDITSFPLFFNLIILYFTKLITITTTLLKIGFIGSREIEAYIIFTFTVLRTEAYLQNVKAKYEQFSI